jgi:hypothetical protein
MAHKMASSHSQPEMLKAKLEDTVTDKTIANNDEAA